MGYTKSLLFINNQQSEILEDHILRQQPVCPDDHIHGSLAYALDCLILFLTAAEPAEHLNVQRIIGEPFTERLVMLLCQNGRRHKNSHLLAFNG
ncbi:hypothetical protein D3C75_628190 [compost metagenome]